MAVAGRTNESITVEGTTVRMEYLRSVLYADRTLASQITGQFVAMQSGRTLDIHIQMQAHTRADRIADAQRRFSALISQRAPGAAVRAVPYADFRYGMGVDYERKHQHLIR